MKKLMLGLGVAAIAITAATPSFAREVKEIVGYVKTETTYSDRDAEFKKQTRAEMAPSTSMNSWPLPYSKTNMKCST